MTVSGNVKMLDGIEHAIIMADRTKIPIEDVRYIYKEDKIIPGDLEATKQNVDFL